MLELIIIIIFIESKTSYQFYEYITRKKMFLAENRFQVERPGPDEKQLIDQRQDLGHRHLVGLKFCWVLLVNVYKVSDP